MFLTQQEEDQARESLNEALNRFNKKYNVLAVADIFLANGSDKKRANKLYVNTFKALLEQAIRGGELGRDFNIATMRTEFERDVVEPCRKFSANKAEDKDVERVKRALADTNGGLGKDEWWREIDKMLDSVYWENIDRVSADYKNRTTRIRDMVAESNNILGGDSEVSRDDVKKITGYIAALRRTNETRSPIWRFLNFFRGRAELREADNMESRLKERLNDPNVYRNALKELTDANGTIGRLKEQIEQKKNIKYDFSAPSGEKSRVKEVKRKEKPEIKEEKLSVDFEEKNVQPMIKEEPKVPGNDQLYRLIGDKSFVANVKGEIRKILKSVAVELNKDTEVDQLYDTMLDNAKTLNENYHSGSNPDEIEANVEDGAISMFSVVYLKLMDFDLKNAEHVIASQKLADTMLNNLTVVGFEKEKLGKYGEQYAVKDENTVTEMLRIKNCDISQDVCDSIVNYAKKELSKERVNVISANEAQKKVELGAKHGNPPTRNTILNK